MIPSYLNTVLMKGIYIRNHWESRPIRTIRSSKNLFRNHDLKYKACKKFGKTEITEKIQLLVQLVDLVWNAEMFS